MKRKLQILWAFIRAHAHLLRRGMWRGERLTVCRVLSGRVWIILTMTPINTEPHHSRVFWSEDVMCGTYCDAQVVRATRQQHTSCVFIIDGEVVTRDVFEEQLAAYGDRCAFEEVS